MWRYYICLRLSFLLSPRRVVLLFRVDPGLRHVIGWFSKFVVFACAVLAHELSVFSFLLRVLVGAFRGSSYDVRPVAYSGQLRLL